MRVCVLPKSLPRLCSLMPSIRDSTLACSARSHAPKHTVLENMLSVDVDAILALEAEVEGRAVLASRSTSGNSV